MKLRDVNGNVVYPEVIDSDGNKIGDVLDSIQNQITTLTNSLNSIESQETELNKITTQLSKIDNDLKYMEKWSTGDLELVTLNTGINRIAIVEGGYWTRRQVTYVAMTIRFETPISDNYFRVCSGFPQPKYDVPLAVYSPYPKYATIDTDGYLVVGIEAGVNDVWYIAGTYATNTY